MLKFTSAVKTKEFELETNKGTQQAFFTEFTMGDAEKIRKAVKDKLEDDNLSAVDKLGVITKERLIASVKDTDNNYLFSNISELSVFPQHIISAMSDQVDELNPWPKLDEEGNQESLESKKEES